MPNYDHNIIIVSIIDLPDFVVVNESKRAKRLALRLDNKERIFKLTIPKGMRHTKAVLFVEDHYDWMRSKLAALPEEIFIEHGVIIPVFGRDIRIEIEYDPSFKRTKIDLHEDILQIKTNKDNPSSRIVRFLKDRAKEMLTNLSAEKALLINKSINNVSVRDTKSRWGSCSCDNNISYSWRLIFAPRAAMDYVVAHEVAHLEYLDHSKKFWNLCRKLSDDYMEGKFWMQNHAQELMRYRLKPDP